MDNTSPQTMRDAFIEGIYIKMAERDDIFFLSADFGAPMLDRLKTDFPDRFINVGIAEQNLINVATGLALEGYIVYAYGIAPFLSMRAFEQIRVNLSMLSQLRKLNVNLIGVGAGLSYEMSGPTHHCLEDMGIMRTLPNIIVCSPSDVITAQELINFTLNTAKPKYVRFDGKPLPLIYGSQRPLLINQGFSHIEIGETLCIVATGYMTHKALRIRDLLKENSIDTGIIDVFLLKEFHEDRLREALSNYKYIVTLEEGFVNRGGLDSLIDAVILNGNIDSRPILHKIGFPDKYLFEIGSREFLHSKAGLNDKSIADSIASQFYLLRERTVQP